MSKRNSGELVQQINYLPVATGLTKDTVGIGKFTLQA